MNLFGFYLNILRLESCIMTFGWWRIYGLLIYSLRGFADLPIKQALKWVEWQVKVTFTFRSRFQYFYFIQSFFLVFSGSFWILFYFLFHIYFWGSLMRCLFKHPLSQNNKSFSHFTYMLTLEVRDEYFFLL